MKKLPDDETLEMLWRVAVTSSISTGLGVHKHYAWALYDYLTDKQPPVGLCDEKSNSKTQKQQGEESSV